MVIRFCGTLKSIILGDFKNLKMVDNIASEKNKKVIDSPVKGPTLSTSTSSFEALDPHDPNLSKLATKTFKKTEEYITNELNAPLEDYKLVEEMNKATIAKYSDMRQIADNLIASTNDLNMKLKNLKVFLDQLDEIEITVNKLEAAAYKLDNYTQALENKFKTLSQKK